MTNITDAENNFIFFRKTFAQGGGDSGQINEILFCISYIVLKGD
tara:strand:+ start:620 stop:751 length:132 start_codon:yes stop_codon:yes gene_type:complete